jgi:glycosyltransferase involved in cell wall biosynthesis
VRREYYRRAITNGLVERAAGRGATTVAVSQQVAEEVRRYYRISVDAVIETCADFEHFKPRRRDQARKRLGLDQKATLALFVGRLEYRKGADMLTEICGRAGCELMVAGDAAPDGAVYLGQLGHEELPWAYAAADCVLFPTRYEGCSFVVLEALACERPLVSTRTGWAPTLTKEIPGYAPYILEPEVEPLAHALRHVLEHPDEVPVAQAADYVRSNLSLERFRERWSRLIDSVVN